LQQTHTHTQLRIQGCMRKNIGEADKQIHVSYVSATPPLGIRFKFTLWTHIRPKPLSHLASLTPCLSQAYEASSNREDAAAADVCMAALYLTVDRPNDAHAFFQRAQSRDSTVANEETLMQLVSDFRAAQTATPTAASTPPSPPPSAPHQDQAHECCKSSADGDGASQAHADHAILPNTSNLSCPVSAHTPLGLPLPFPAALAAAGISRHAPLCAWQASSCARQGGKGGGQERGAIERGRERGAGDERGAAQSHTLYTNTVLVRALSCPLSIRMHSYEALLAATAATQASRLVLASSCPADNSTSLSSIGQPPPP
jgi:hypothetical protein